ncbi:hypothetical protein E3H11_10450 [Bradyrhizobium brasilense]|uniref:hypothetical protein n=1 Tax=Bradyrhizobium brasilense TaxID=1419277 RepID=UPI001456E1A6|nr:hypothetical protein [Bradyrhizobium brasilense]NLS69332.1 hypothetical protein [Bradyrhizobium brasilense]
MKRTPLVLFALFIAAVSNTTSWAMDPNAACADAIPTVRKLLMDESAFSRNLLEPIQVFVKGARFSAVAEEIRRDGAEKFVVDAITNVDKQALCDESMKACYTPEQAIELWKPVIPKLSMWPKLYDTYYMFYEIRATDYEPNLQRATCRAAFWFNLPLLKAYLGGASQDIEIYERQEKLLRATGQSYSRRFTVQPDGGGGLAVRLIANP